MAAYYNEFDPFAAEWLRKLIAAGQIAPGDVDERDMREVDPSDLKGYTQCHFFAGIGGWLRAAELAGVSQSEPLWTASLPCQPFSTAGKQGAHSDDRHLLPHFMDFVIALRPPLLMGEQVANAINLGWLDDLYDSFEVLGYEVSSAVIPAAAVGAPHIRSRLWWTARRMS